MAVLKDGVGGPAGHRRAGGYQGGGPEVLSLLRAPRRVGSSSMFEDLVSALSMMNDRLACWSCVFEFVWLFPDLG
jgi:hypothetical protein